DGRGLRRELQPAVRVATQYGAQLLVYDGNDLLGGCQAFQNLATDRPLLDPRAEILCDPEVNVCLEQRQADLAQRLRDVGLAQRPLPAQALEDILKLAGKGFE